MTASSSCQNPIPPQDLSYVFEKLLPLWDEFRGKRLFLAGATGIVGKWLIETLDFARRHSGLDCHITILSRSINALDCWPSSVTEGNWISLVTGDIRDFELPTGSFDYVIHAASDCSKPSSESELFDTCLRGTRRLLDMAKQCGAKKFLFISSGTIYGPQPVDLDAIPESYGGAPDPLNLSQGYSCGKRAAEWMCAAFGKESGIDVKIARIFSMAGPHLPLDSKYAFGNFIRDVMENRPIIIQGDGRVYRSYMYLADTSVWLWTLLIRGTTGVAYNVSGPAQDSISVRDLADRVNKVLNGQSEVRVLTPITPGKPPSVYVADITKAERELGLSTSFTLDEIIAKTAAWHVAGLSQQ